MKAKEIQPLFAAHSALTPTAAAVASQDIATATGAVFAEIANQAAHSASYKGGKNADVTGRLAAAGSLGNTPQARQLAFLCDAAKLAKKYGSTVQVGLVDGFKLREKKPAAKPAEKPAAAASV